MNNKLYHFTSKSEYEAAKTKGVYTPESLQSEGFIHFSKEEQVLQSANLFGKGQHDLVLLCINPAQLEAKVVYENTTSGNELFPHLYGPLNLDAVEKVVDFPPNTEGLFEWPF